MIRADFSLAHDLAAANPDKLKAMQALFMKEAEANHVCRSTTARSSGSTRRSPAARPDGGTDLADPLSRHERQRELLHQPQERFAHDHRRPHRSAGRGGGRAARARRKVRRLELLREGRQADLRIQLPGPERYRIAADKPLAPGKATVQFDFAYDGGGIGKGGTAGSSSTARRSPRGASTRRNAASSRSTRRPTSACRPARPRARIIDNPFAFTGTLDHVVVDLAPGPDAASAEARKWPRMTPRRSGQQSKSNWLDPHHVRRGSTTLSSFEVFASGHVDAQRPLTSPLAPSAVTIRNGR